jgi:hypothetical protein
LIHGDDSYWHPDQPGHQHPLPLPFHLGAGRPRMLALRCVP